MTTYEKIRKLVGDEGINAIAVVDKDEVMIGATAEWIKEHEEFAKALFEKVTLREVMKIGKGITTEHIDGLLRGLEEGEKILFVIWREKDFVGFRAMSSTDTEMYVGLSWDGFILSDEENLIQVMEVNDESK